MKIDWLQYFDNSRKKSVWYGGAVVKIEYDHYIITIGAYGDNIGYIDNNYYVDKNNKGKFADYLEQNFICNDTELRIAIAQNRVEFESNNWYEVTIWDTEKKEWITDCDNILRDDEIDENDFSWVEGWLKEILAY